MKLLEGSTIIAFLTVASVVITPWITILTAYFPSMQLANVVLFTLQYGLSLTWVGLLIEGVVHRYKR